MYSRLHCVELCQYIYQVGALMLLCKRIVLIRALGYALACTYVCCIKQAMLSVLLLTFSMNAPCSEVPFLTPLLNTAVLFASYVAVK
jgi:hypothetical protein